MATSSPATTAAGSRGPSLRRLVGLAILLPVLFSGLLVGAYLLRPQEVVPTPAPYQGTRLDGQPAPDFSLHSVDGQAVRLADFRGKPVVLTFVYSTCPDVCPLLAAKLRATLDRLGPDANRLAVLAVSTDPEGDNPTTIRLFERKQGMEGRWQYLVGTHDELADVWKAYYIATFKPGQGPNPVEETARGALGHTDAVYLIDSQGRRQLVTDLDFTPEQLAADIRTLR